VRQAGDRGRRLKQLLFIAGARLVLTVVLLAAWQLVSGRLVPTYYVSSPTQIAARLGHLIATGSVWNDFDATAEEFVLGYVIGVATGLVFGLALGALPRFARLVEPLITALNGIPKIALAPLLVLWLGIGLWSKVGIAVTTVFFVMFYNTYLGMRTVPEQLVNALKVMGAGRATIIRRVVIPQMSMPILAGLKAGIPFTAIGVIVGEFVASDHGLGYYIRSSSDNYDAAGIYSGIVLLMVLILVLGFLVGIWERRVTRWRR
jgi:NitT/TauT family transport system permease protein